MPSGCDLRFCYGSVSRLNLVIMGATITGYLLARRDKAHSTRTLIGAIVGLGLYSVAAFLTSSCGAAGATYYPLQVASLTVGVVFGMQFAYRYPARAHVRESRIVLAFSLVILAVIVALGSLLVMTVMGMRSYSDETLRLVMILSSLPPLSFLASVAIFVRQALWHARRGLPDTERLALGQALHALRIPPNRDVDAMRAYGIAFFFGIAPAASQCLVVWKLMQPMSAFGFAGVGTLVMYASLFLAYLQYGPEKRSLAPKISVVVMFIALSALTAAASLASSSAFQVFRQERESALQIAETLVGTGEYRDLYADAAYIVAYHRDSADHHVRPDVVLSRVPGDDLSFISDENALAAEDPSLLEPRVVIGMTSDVYRSQLPGRKVIFRYAANPLGFLPKYAGYIVSDGEQDYEIGYGIGAARQRYGQAPVRWMVLSLVVSGAAWILVVMSLRQSVLDPLARLVNGMRRVNVGDRMVAVPVEHEDEIGYLTRSLNSMVQSMARSESSLRDANEMLERRVVDRTVELVTANAQLLREAAERRRLISELQEALASVTTLSGLLPICAHCKKIRDDRGYWQAVEAYIGEHADVSFTHGICPECVAKLYPDLAEAVSDGEAAAPAELAAGQAVVPVRIPGVDAYLRGLASARRAALATLRELVLRVCPQATETMRYRMPTYVLGEQVLCSFAAQKRYMSLYLDSDVLAEHISAFDGLSVGKSCVRFTRVEALDMAAVETVLRETVARYEAGEPSPKE